MSETATITAPASPADALPIGTIVYESWGWEQTNVSFYEVVGHTKSGKSARLRKIAKSTVPGSEGFMSAKVKPVPGSFIGEEFTKRIMFSTWRGETNPYLSMSSYSSATPTDPSEAHYTSWYA